MLGANGNKSIKWEAHSGATAPGQFCAFDTAQGRAVRDFYTDFAGDTDYSFMIQCCECDNWYHGVCVGVDVAMATNLNSWACASCK